jgi:hypothetical protein
VGRLERDILERSVRAVAEQAVKADDLVDEAATAGGADQPITIHAKMLRLELLNVKADLERELGNLSLNCRRCGLDVHWVPGPRLPDRRAARFPVRAVVGASALIRAFTWRQNAMPGRSSVRGRLHQIPPGQGSENHSDHGEQRWDRQSEAVPEHRLDWEQPKLQHGSRAFAGPQ